MLSFSQKGRHNLYKRKMYRGIKGVCHNREGTSYMKGGEMTGISGVGRHWPRKVTNDWLKTARVERKQDRLLVW